MKTIGLVIATFLVLDYSCFFLWLASGQTPVDGFYFGAITAKLLGFVLGF